MPTVFYKITIVLSNFWFTIATEYLFQARWLTNNTQEIERNKRTQAMVPVNNYVYML